MKRPSILILNVVQELAIPLRFLVDWQDVCEM